MNFGEKLKQLRHQANWTQPEAANAIGIEQSYLSKLENDKSLPSSEVFEQILCAYKLGMEHLLLGLSSQTQAQLKGIPQVANFLGQLKQLSLKAYRNWLIAAFILFGSGAFLLAGGMFEVIPTKTINEYLSLGVVKEGERPDIFREYDQYISLLPIDDYKAMRMDILNRVTEERRFFEDGEKGHSFLVEVEGGLRRFEQAGWSKVHSPLNAWFKAIGSMLMAMSLGCLFMARYWK